MGSQEIGNGLNIISLLIMTILLVYGSYLIMKPNKSNIIKDKRFLKLGIGWLCWAISYVLIAIRLGITIDDGEIHIIMYQIILTLDAFGFTCFFFYIGHIFTDNNMETGVYSKKSFDIIGWILFIIQTLFIWIAGGFGVEDTPFGVEILPSFVCQQIMALSMILGGVFFILSGNKFSKLNLENESKICKILGLFMVILIIHIFTTVWAGHGIFAGLLLILFRIVLGACPVIISKKISIE